MACGKLKHIPKDITPWVWGEGGGLTYCFRYNSMTVIVVAIQRAVKTQWRLPRQNLIHQWMPKGFFLAKDWLHYIELFCLIPGRVACKAQFIQKQANIFLVQSDSLQVTYFIYLKSPYTRIDSEYIQCKAVCIMLEVQRYDNMYANGPNGTASLERVVCWLPRAELPVSIGHQCKTPIVPRYFTQDREHKQQSLENTGQAFVITTHCSTVVNSELLYSSSKQWGPLYNHWWV